MTDRLNSSPRKEDSERLANERHSPGVGRIAALAPDGRRDSDPLCRLSGILEAMNVGTWEWNVKTGTLEVDDRWREIVGLAAGEPAPNVRTWWRMIHPLDRSVARDILRGLFSGGRPSLKMDVRLRHGGGHWVWVEVSGKLVDRPGEANPLIVYGALTDISERKWTEEALRESYRRYDQLAEQSRTFAWEVDSEGRYTFVSPVVSLVLGYRPEELVGEKFFYDICPPEDKESVKAFGLETMRCNGSLSGYENRVVDREGRVHWVMSSGMPLLNDRGEPIGFRGADTDITDRKMAEEQRQLLTTALDAAANTMIITDREGVIKWANRAFTETTGYTLEEAMGRTPGELLKSGVHDDAFYRRIWTTILAGRVWSGEMVNRKKDGSLYPEQLTITPVEDDRGEIHHFIAIKRDLTEEKAREKEAFRNQRLESIGTLAGGIAHDLNNALTPILISVDLLRSSIQDDVNQHYLSNIEISATRSAEMVRQVLNFAQGVEGERTVLNFRHLVREIEKLVTDTFPGNIELRIDAPGDSWTILGDVTQLQQVLLNLCVNARDAMTEGGVLSLTLKNEPAMAEEFGVEPLPQEKGDFLKIVVADTGCGMTSRIQEKIFDPFFTTKEVDKGTGLGLSTAHSIVKGHGGFIRVESVPGKGTAFEVYLPRYYEETGETKTASSPAKPAVGRNEELLVVDDNELVRSTLCSLLTSSGYRVSEARNEAEALEIFRSNGSRFAAILMDLAMPRLHGISTIKAIRELQPDVPIIATSGHPPAGQDADTDPVDRFLSKPYTQHEVLIAVREVLDGTDAVS